MGWLLELLFGALREMCSQFIVDMMDIASGMFTEILSCDLDMFEELFGVAGDLYRNAILPIAIALLLMILVWQLFKSMFGKLGTASEDPLELVFRSCICLFMIAFAKSIVNYIMEFAGTPYQWITGTQITVESFSGYVSASEAVTSVLGGDAISIQLLLLIMQFVVAWNYFKMLFLLAERYVLLGVFSYTSPLAFATGGSKATNNILGTWAKMFGGQVLIVLLDAWCVKMFLSGYGNLMASSYGFTRFFAATMCLIGFCKITGKLDSYMGSLGVNLGRSGGGLSGLGALMMAGRLFHGGARAASGGAQNTGGAGAGHMNFGSGKPIPLGKGGPDFGAAAGMAGADQGSGIGGMAAENDGSGTMQTPWTEAGNKMAATASDNPAMTEPGLPFGDPDAMEAGTPGIFEDMEDMDAMGNGQEPDGFGPEEEWNYQQAGNGLGAMDGLNSQPDTDIGMNQEIAGPFGENSGIPDAAGSVPGMDMPVGGPFGQPDDGSDGSQPISGSLDQTMDMPLEADGIGEMPADLEAGHFGGAGGASVSSGEILVGTEDSGIVSGSGTGYSTEGTGSMPENGIHGTGSAVLAGQEGANGAVQTNGTVGSADGYGAENPSSYGMAESYGTAGTYGTEEAYGYDNGAEESYGAMGSPGAMGGYSLESAAEGGTIGDGSQPHGYTEALNEGGWTPASAAYPVERDGEPYMRYDARQYEKPEGAYQTVHENGRTFYELPRGEKAPAILPQTKAVLEKSGNIRLEEVSRKENTGGSTGRQPAPHSGGTFPVRQERVLEKKAAPEIKLEPERKAASKRESEETGKESQENARRESGAAGKNNSGRNTRQ